MQEWLSGRYTEDYGYPNPSVKVLVNVVEHEAGGADPSLARHLTTMKFDADNLTKDDSTSGTVYMHF